MRAVESHGWRLAGFPRAIEVSGKREGGRKNIKDQRKGQRAEACVQSEMYDMSKGNGDVE
jgi:hypothetical protein